MAEMVSMGVGNKAFRDIAPNEEAISDRTINYVLKSRGSREGGVKKAAREAVRTSVSLSSLPSGPRSRWALTCPNLTLSHAEVRSRASIAVAPFDCESPYLGASSPLPADPASGSVLGSLNLHLYRDPTPQGLRWPLHSTCFPEETALEAEGELGSQPSLSRSGLSQRQGGTTWALGHPC